MNNNTGAWLWIALVIGLVYASQSGPGGCTVNPPVQVITAPIPDPGLRVLITYPEATRDSLPAGQKALLQSSTIRAYLDQNCVKDENGTPEKRIWKDDADPKNESVIWQKLMAIAKGKGAWVVAGNGKQGVNQALPADEQSLIKLLDPLKATP